MKKFFLNLQFIFRPSYWIMNHAYDESIDILMNALMDKYEFTRINEYTAYLGDTEIWIVNQPYACMVPYPKIHNARASRLTTLRGINKLEQDKINSVLK